MSNWTSISVKEAQKDELNEAKDKIDHNGSMGEFLVQLAEFHEEASDWLDEQDLDRLDFESNVEYVDEESDNASVDTAAIDELQETLEELDTENVGRTAVQVSKLQEEIGRLQDQVNQLEKTLEGLR